MLHIARLPTGERGGKRHLPFRGSPRSGAGPAGWRRWNASSRSAALPGYRRSDAATMRWPARRPGANRSARGDAGVTRQAARKVATALEQRGYAATRPDPDDARKVNIRPHRKGAAVRARRGHSRRAGSTARWRGGLPATGSLPLTRCCARWSSAEQYRALTTGCHGPAAGASEPAQEREGSAGVVSRALAPLLTCDESGPPLYDLIEGETLLPASLDRLSPRSNGCVSSSAVCASLTATIGLTCVTFAVAVLPPHSAERGAREHEGH